MAAIPDDLRDWISKTLNTESVPIFEENSETIAALQSIKKCYEENVKHTTIREKQMRKEIQEFNSEKARVGGILSELSLNEKDLSPKLSAYSKTLTSVASDLGTARPTQTCLTIAMSDFVQDQARTEMELLNSEQICAQFSEKIAEMCAQRDVLSRKFEDLEASLPDELKNAESIKRSTHFHAQKKKDYQRQIIGSEKQLKSASYSDKISHSTLVKMGKKVKELEDRIKPLRLQLDSYKCLPPNLDQSKLKLHEKMSELKDLEEELHELFQHFNLS